MSNMEYAAKLNMIIERKGMRKKDFAESLGWSKSYLSQLLSGSAWGISPIVTLLSAYPDIDARWFILG